ncbi:MAG: hypothetical protein ACNYWU_05835 [Desulfobacterales bacterium]
MQTGDKFELLGDKKLTFRKEDGYYVSFDPKVFEIMKINEFAGDILYMISLGMNYSEISKIITLRFNVNQEVFKSDIVKFFRSYPSISYIKTMLIELGFRV